MRYRVIVSVLKQLTRSENIMNILNHIIENGFNQSSVSALKVAITGDALSDRTTTFTAIKAAFNECDDLEVLKPFSKIMIDEFHVVDVEPKMIKIMGEDEFFDFIG